MALDFPTSPSVGTRTSIDNKTWEYNGKGWKLLPNQIQVVVDQLVTLNDISASFNGSSTQFTISDASGNFINSEIDTVARLLISIGGIVQQPDPSQTAGFYISGGTDRTTDPIKINFVEAPKSGLAFFGVAIKSTSSPTTSFVTSEESIAYSIVFGV